MRSRYSGFTKAENARLPAERKMEFRIGINLGDVIVQGEQLYGDGVNVAARLESLAEPGGILISSSVHEQIRNKLELVLTCVNHRNMVSGARSARLLWSTRTVRHSGCSSE